jgi:hypothetical protein
MLHRFRGSKGLGTVMWETPGSCWQPLKCNQLGKAAKHGYSRTTFLECERKYAGRLSKVESRAKAQGQRLVQATLSLGSVLNVLGFWWQPIDDRKGRQNYVENDFREWKRGTDLRKGRAPYRSEAAALIVRWCTRVPAKMPPQWKFHFFTPKITKTLCFQNIITYFTTL